MACGFGYGLSGRYQFQPNENVGKLNYFPGKFQYAGQNTENYDKFDTDEKKNREEIYA
jgi:hypothetical protein